MEREDELHRQLLPQPIAPEVAEPEAKVADSSSLSSLNLSADKASSGPPTKRKKRAPWAYQPRNVEAVSMYQKTSV